MRKASDTARNYLIQNPTDYHYSDIALFFNAALPTVCHILQGELELHSPLKYTLGLLVEYVHLDGEQDLINFKTRNRTIFANCIPCIVRSLQNDGKKLLSEEIEYAVNNSGWTMYSVESLSVKVSKITFRLMKRTVTGSHYIKLPEHIEKTKSCFIFQVSCSNA